MATCRIIIIIVVIVVTIIVSDHQQHWPKFIYRNFFGGDSTEYLRIWSPCSLPHYLCALPIAVRIRLKMTKSNINFTAQVRWKYGQFSTAAIYFKASKIICLLVGNVFCLLAIKKLLDISNTSTHTHTHAQAHVMYAVGKKVATSIFGMDMEKFCV